MVKTFRDLIIAFENGLICLGFFYKFILSAKIIPPHIVQPRSLLIDIDESKNFQYVFFRN